MKMKLLDALAILAAYNSGVQRGPLSDEDFATYRKAYDVVRSHAARTMHAHRQSSPPKEAA